MLFQGQGGRGILLARDVPEMVNHVVQEVLKKRHNRELCTVGADAASSILLRRERLDPGNETLCGGLQFVSNHLRVLLALALLDGGLVLVPVGESRGVFAEHLDQASIE